MTGQSKRQSFAETCSNTFLGTVGSLLITNLCMRYSPYGIDTTSVIIVLLCTGWSLGRGYMMRRTFNRLTTRG